MAKLPQTFTNANIKIDQLVPGGQGIGTTPADFAGTLINSSGASTGSSSAANSVVAAGKKGFFWNALPGEIVTDFIVTKSKSHYFEAAASAIISPSKNRITPKDACFLATSPWQIMDYEYELKMKRELLIETFRQANLSAYDIQPVKTDGHDYFYRNKMEYSLYWDVAESKIKPAMHARGSHRKIPLETSSIERPEIFQKAQQIIADLNARGEEARKFQSLLLRSDQNGNVSGGLYENHQPHPVFPNLSDKILGQTYSYSPNGFFQINLPVYEMALLEIKNHIKTDEVLDLYAGVGTIGLSVASNQKLTLVECNKFAFSELQKNCESSIDVNATPILANSEDALEHITQNQTVILDPPRAGCNRKLLDKLLAVLPPTIIYLSCNPATQARDLKILESKYAPELIQPFNFFPRTPHLENLVILQRRK